MGLINSKINGQSNNTLKLIFPSHGLPFIIPYTVLPDIATRIDDILKDMEQKNSTPKASWRLKLPGGRVLEAPSPDDWVLVDIENSLLIHSSVLDALVVVGATYMVLPIRTSDLTVEDLKQVTQRGREESLPPYDH